MTFPGRIEDVQTELLDAATEVIRRIHERVTRDLIAALEGLAAGSGYESRGVYATLARALRPIAQTCDDDLVLLLALGM